MNGFFITGTDTGVGKTLVSSILAATLDGYYWKPIQSDTPEEVANNNQLLQLFDLPAHRFLPSVYALPLSLSPNQAAHYSGVEIDLNECVLPEIQEKNKLIIVEGAGGVYVPLNDNHTMLDLMQKLALPIIIVARGTLGTINHTLLTIEVLRQRNLNIHGIIFNGELNPDSQRDIEIHGRVKTLLHVPQFDLRNKENIQKWKEDSCFSIVKNCHYDTGHSEDRSSNLVARDQATIWHPYTQHQILIPPIPIVRGKGAYLFDQNGKSYLDLISSWWTNIHGHSHPAIAKAIYEQALTVEHVIFGGFTHQPAILLAEKLLQLLPTGFAKVFYSDNGSTSVEVALKMAYQYWRNRGEFQRKRFLAFSQGYHGDTFGAMAIGHSLNIFQHFADLLFKVDIAPYPETWYGDEDIDAKENQALNWIENYFNEHASETAALIIEPLVQGHAGMRMCRPQFLLKLQNLAQRYQILIIYDEVMTGFGRTGETFACTKAGTTPDIICLAKGITGGFLPLSVTVCHEQMYQAFLSDSFSSALVHGHTYTANPLGCTAGLASLEILQTPETLNQIQIIEQTHEKELKSIARLPGVQNVRQTGTIAAFNIKQQAGLGSSLSHVWRQSFQDRGLLIRLLGNAVYLLPPYCMTQSELEWAYKQIAEVVEQIMSEENNESLCINR